jgi:hypothetical protein
MNNYLGYKVLDQALSMIISAMPKAAWNVIIKSTEGFQSHASCVTRFIVNVLYRVGGTC